MIRWKTPDESEERARGQLFLFAAPDPRPAPSRDESPPDLDRLFDELNGRHFAGRLQARIEWSERLTSSAGSCRPKERLIRISLPYHRRRPEALRVTLAHEMLHLVCPGHGPEFRRLGRMLARALGATWREFRYAERFADLTRYRYVYACSRCGLELPSRKRRMVSCGGCAPGHYDEAFRLVLTESRARPGPVLRGERPVALG